MPVDMATFDASRKKGRGSLGAVCGELGLTQDQCKGLAGKLPSLCRIKKPTKSGKRPVTKWQQCIKERRSGKPFDPAAIKQLAAEYRAGRCPSG